MTPPRVVDDCAVVVYAVAFDALFVSCMAAMGAFALVAASIKRLGDANADSATPGDVAVLAAWTASSACNAYTWARFIHAGAYVQATDAHGAQFARNVRTVRLFSRGLGVHVTGALACAVALVTLSTSTSATDDAWPWTLAMVARHVVFGVPLNAVARRAVRRQWVAPLRGSAPYTTRLYHETSAASAASILSSHSMLPSAQDTSMLGSGIYFASCAEQARLKARARGVTLCADVRLGRCLTIDDAKRWDATFTPLFMHEQRCRSAMTYVRTGLEYLVARTDDVSNIRVWTDAADAA